MKQVATALDGPAGQVRRVFDHHRLWRLSGDAFAAAANLIAAHEAPARPQMIVGIARGGTPLARHLAGRLGVDAVEVSARHNTTDTTYLQATGRVEVTQPAVARPRPGARLLVVDDICGTGATLAAVTTMLTGWCAPAGLRTAVLCRNAAADDTTSLPDVWVWRLRDWVVFPWETFPDREEPTEDLAVPGRISTKETR